MLCHNSLVKNEESDRIKIKQSIQYTTRQTDRHTDRHTDNDIFTKNSGYVSHYSTI